MNPQKRSSLVLVGNEIKVRLEAERTHSKTPVHVDWVRFTVQRRNTLSPALEMLFPHPEANVWDEKTRHARFRRILADLPDCDSDVAAQAMELATETAAMLGEEFTVNPLPKKGQDFYKFRLSIERNGVECGWVGFMASSDSPRQRAQAATLHVNIPGTACTFAVPGWNHRLADLIDRVEGDITRCDLALDFFDGFDGGIKRIEADYRAGLLDVGGKRLKCRSMGDWSNDGVLRTGGRSFYAGSKESGKETNYYEKGDQLYGVEHGSPWLRAELRYGNKLRVLQTEMLRRPADFFAGASEYHAMLIAHVGALQVIERVRCNGRLAAQSVEAEVARNVRWLRHTAAPTLAQAVQHIGTDRLWEMLEGAGVPGRLRKFKQTELSTAYTTLLEEQTA